MLDAHNTGLVTSYHLMTYLRCDTDNKFIKRMLSQLRKGQRFDGFIIAIWDFCTLKRSDLGELFLGLLKNVTAV